MVDIRIRIPLSQGGGAIGKRMRINDDIKILQRRRVLKAAREKKVDTIVVIDSTDLKCSEWFFKNGWEGKVIAINFSSFYEKKTARLEREYDLETFKGSSLDYDYESIKGDYVIWLDFNGCVKIDNDDGKTLQQLVGESKCRVVFVTSAYRKVGKDVVEKALEDILGFWKTRVDHKCMSFGNSACRKWTNGVEGKGHLGFYCYA